MSQPLQLQPQRRTLFEAFGHSFPKNITVEGWKHCDHPLVPKALPHWTWERELLFELVAWWVNGQTQPLLVRGPTGCGKSSSIRQFCAALGIPLYAPPITDELEFADLVVTTQLTGGNTIPTYAHLPLAMGAEGAPGIFLADDMDRARPAVLMAMKGIWENFGLQVDAYGIQSIAAHPSFRFAGTANTSLRGDPMHLYSTAKTQDFAVVDCFRVVRAGYLSAEAETDAVARAVPDLPSELIRMMVSAANAVRAAFMGVNSACTALPVTMSTRTLLRWATMTVERSGAASDSVTPVLHALQVAFLNSLDDLAPEVRQATEALIHGKLPAIEQPADAA